MKGLKKNILPFFEKRLNSARSMVRSLPFLIYVPIVNSVDLLCKSTGLPVKIGAEEDKKINANLSSKCLCL